jgi:methyltransferase (TIGR00027 family)
MSSKPVRHVSDTARWVAAYRALESARSDAIFHDHLADRLAGERGYAIAKLASVHSQWALVTRTRIIDDLVMKSVAQGTDCVLNLAAGFDTRPYRLGLPQELLWIEADLPALIDEKDELLRDEVPQCKLARERVDLTNTAARTALFDDINHRASRTLVISEGLVIYLENAVVSQLAQALAAVPNFAHWIVDFSSPEILEMQQRSMGAELANAPFKFAATEGLDFFEREGWKAESVLSLMREAGRLRRLPTWMRLFAVLPQPDPRKRGGRWSVVTEFAKVPELKKPVVA